VHLTSDLLCLYCVKNQCLILKLSNAINGDTKTINDLLKEPVDET
jgi:hypothetical protein